MHRMSSYRKREEQTVHPSKIPREYEQKNLKSSIDQTRSTDIPTKQKIILHPSQNKYHGFRSNLVHQQPHCTVHQVCIDSWHYKVRIAARHRSMRVHWYSLASYGQSTANWHNPLHAKIRCLDGNFWTKYEHVATKVCSYFLSAECQGGHNYLLEIIATAVHKLVWWEHLDTTTLKMQSTDPIIGYTVVQITSNQSKSCGRGFELYAMTGSTLMITS